MKCHDVKFTALIEMIEVMTQDELEDIELIINVTGVKRLKLMLESAKVMGEHTAVSWLSVALTVCSLKEIRRFV